MSHPDLQGYYNAPVSLALLTASVGATAVNIFLRGESSKSAGLVFDASAEKLPLLRLITSYVAFDHPAAALFGLGLLFQFRFVERMMGSRKFGAFLFLTWAISGMLQVGTLVTVPTVRSTESGPIPFIFAMLSIFHAKVPKLHPSRFTVAGVSFSEKTQTYVMCLMLMSISGKKSAIPSISGLVAGRIYLSEVVPLQSFRLPRFILSLFAMLHPLFHVEAPSALQRQMQRRRQMQLQRQMAAAQAAQLRGQGRMPAAVPGMNAPGTHQRIVHNPAPAPPPDDAIQSLMAMGFEREQVVRALQATGNNVEAAANRLLSS